jgi:small subunit ribosomal protein S6
MLLREYETIYILRPDMPDEGMAQVNDRLAGVLEREGAKILRHDVWGKKKLAFEMKKHPKGVYVYLSYLGKGDSIREIERNLRMIEPVLGYQTLKVAENVDVERRLAEQEAENQARAAEEAKRKAEEEARAAQAAQIESYEAFAASKSPTPVPEAAAPESTDLPKAETAQAAESEPKADEPVDTQAAPADEKPDGQEE